MVQCVQGRYSQGQTGAGTGNRQDGQVKHDFDIFDDEAGNQYLTQIVEYTASHAHTNQREFSGAFQQVHSAKAQGCSGSTVQKGVYSAAKGG